MSLGRVLVERFQPEVLEWLGARVEIVVVDPWAEPERWEAEAPAVDAVISRKGRITRQHMEKSRGRLKIVARTGVGFDPSRIDIDAAREHKVWVTNMPGSNAAAVAELTFGQMIALARHTMEAHRAVKENRWSDYLRFLGAELAGKTLGIVGMGNIGTRVALRARAFEMSLLVCDPYIPASHVTALGGRWVGLEELFTESDFVTLHCPLNRETHHMVGERQLALMKRSAYLVNLARGGVVDENALHKCLERKAYRWRGHRRHGNRAAAQGSPPDPVGQCDLHAAHRRIDPGSAEARRMGRRATRWCACWRAKVRAPNAVRPRTPNIVLLAHCSPGREPILLRLADMPMGKEIYRIGITGSYGGLNLGDEAILQSIIAQLRKDLPKVEITVFSRDAEDTKRRHQVERAVPVRKLSRAEVTPEIERLDLLVLGGGGILYDADARTYLREVQLAREKRVPVFVYAIGAGPLTHAAAQAAVRENLADVEVVTVREKSAHRVLEEVGLHRDSGGDRRSGAAAQARAAAARHPAAGGAGRPPAADRHVGARARRRGARPR